MLIAVLTIVAGTLVLLAPGAGAAMRLVPISGSGSSWASNALDSWRRYVNNLDGITVNYSPTGSTSGRKDFSLGTVDFAVSEIPYGLTDAGVPDPPPSTRNFGYMPIVAGGTAFMYNLKIGGKPVTNLRLSGDTITKIFTQKITNWADPAIKADNPGLTLPARTIVPVVRSDGAGTTAQFTAWMASQYGGLWDDFCHLAGRNITPCGVTSFYPPHGLNSKSGSQGVAGFVAQDSSEGAITYVEYSYARNTGFPVVKVLNAANYYVEPTASNVAVALLKAKINSSDPASDLSQVYVNPDPRAYPLSSYSYMIIPTDTRQSFNTDKGQTLSEFAYYALCDGQQQADALGYAPLPINLVQAGIDQVAQIPGSTHKLNSNNLSSCHNPTVSPNGTDLLATNAPQPDPCDLKGATPCSVTGPPTPTPIPIPIPTPTPTPGPGPGPVSSDSAVTKSGEGDFKDLKVTVSQTKNLINQNVRVSWTGGAPTVDAGGGVGSNFLQIMQCWGDDPAGPDRTQCEFGANTAGTPAAAVLTVRSRQTVASDSAENLDGGPNHYQVVPFWPVGRQRPTALVQGADNDSFDGQVTNEIPIAVTHGNGTGQVDFEIQTVVQSAGLGCGAPVEVNGTTAGRSCWLVIVPRGTKDFNGSTPAGGLKSGPLTPGNWANKIAVPLSFVPQGRPCPLGAPQRPLSGHELVTEAVSRWQPALCANGGAQYTLTQLDDNVVRSQLLGTSDPGLALVSSPVPPDQQPAARPLVYAPVAVSGLAFAFNIVANPPNLGVSGPNDPRQGVAGQQYTEMNLTPRLVAKLLTQSYQGAIAGNGKAVPEGTGIPAQPARLQSNPTGLTNDPEFLKFNPSYQLDPNVASTDRDLLPNNLYVDALVQGGTSDLTRQLWDWVLADQEARDFIDGKADPWGMVVNDANKGLQPPLDTYPRNDQSCTPVTASGKVAPFCTGDEHPFADDMHTAGRAASRGDPLGRDPTNPQVTADSVTFGKKPRQQVTERALMAVVDAATAARYDLPTAKLRNAAGQFVGPDAAGLQAGLDAMKPSPVPGVLQPDPATNNPAAYPLTSVSNAVTSPPALTKDAGQQYATFLRYAVGAGQQPGQGPGQLPFGYLPLPEPLRQQALAAATTIETQAGKTATATTTGLDVTPASPVTAGTTETLTARVTPAVAGSVQFLDGTASIGNPVAVSGGTTTSTTTLPSGTHSLTAVFTPTDPAAFGGSTSPAVTFVVNTATQAMATTTTLTVSPNSAAPVILRATVAPPTAVGTVQFTDGTTALGAPVPVVGGHAILLTPTLTQGTHSLTAVFTPTDPAAFGPSSSPPMSATVTEQSLRIITFLQNFLQNLLQFILSGLHL